MKDIIRDSTVGQILNWVSNGAILPYEDQRKDYVIPARYLPGQSSFTATKKQLEFPRTNSDANTLVNEPGSVASSKEHRPSDGDVEKGQSTEAAPAPETPVYPYLVDWEADDQDNPR